MDKPWYSTLDRDEIEKVLGADHVRWLLRQENPASYCAGAAEGMWQANQKEAYNAYSSLAKLLAKQVNA